MKKTISFMLALCLLFSSVSFGVLAADTNSEEYMQAQALVNNSLSADVTFSHIDQVIEDIQLLEQTPFSIFNDFCICGIDKSGNILYELCLADNTRSIFSIHKEQANGISIQIVENGVQNTLTYKDSKVYLNGHTIEFSNESVNNARTMPASANVATNVYTTSPVYGTASSYMYHTGQVKKNVVDFGCDWIELTKTAACWALAAALVVAGLPGMLEYSDLLVDVATWAIAQGAYIPNDTAYMSFIYDTYVPASQPATSMHWKLICVFYSDSDYQGTTYYKTLYESYYY